MSLKCKFFPKLFAVLLAAAFIFSLSGFAAAAEGKSVNLSIGSFKSGSGWYVLGQAVSQVVKKTLPAGSVVDVMPYSGGVGNPMILHQGKVNLALGFPFLTILAMDGEAPYKEPAKELRLLAAGLDTYWYLFAAGKGAGLTNFAQLKKKKYPLKLVMEPKGSTGEWMNNAVLKAYGMNFDDIKKWGGRVTLTSFGNSIKMMMDGQADAFGHVATPGHPAWTELATMVKLNFFTLDKQTTKNLAAKYGFKFTVIPKGTFSGITADLPTLGWSSSLITTAKLPDDLAYAVTKAVCESKDDLVATYKGAKVFDPKTAWDTPVPLHPGALKYYKEKGYKK